MEQPQEEKGSPGSLEEVLDRLVAAAQHEDVSLDELMDRVGRHSFGSLLLLAGLLTLAPVVGDIPGVATVLGGFAFLIAAQMLGGMEHFWLPRWLLERGVKRAHLESVIRWMRPAARFMDRVLKARYLALAAFSITGVTYMLVALSL